MSWDISLGIDVGADELKIVWETNMTYNVSSMYYDAIELEDGLRGFDHMDAIDAVPILDKYFEREEMMIVIDWKFFEHWAKNYEIVMYENEHSTYYTLVYKG